MSPTKLNDFASLDGGEAPQHPAFPRKETSLDGVYKGRERKNTLSSRRREVNTPEKAWNVVEQTFKTHFWKPDLEAVRLVCAAIAAHSLKGQPVWPMLIAPPGSMKTELLKSLTLQRKIYTVDSVTPRTFLSGQFGNTADAPASLLHRIGSSGIILIPDFSTVTGKHHNDRMQIYADLRRIFDGDLEKHFGTRDGSLRWEGRITVAVAATPSIDTLTSFEGALGDRFVRIRMPRSDWEAAKFAQRQDPQEVRRATTNAIAALFKTLSKTAPRVPDGIATSLAKLADFTAIGRTYVSRDYITKDIEEGEAHDAESATRLSQQFAQLSKGLALVAGRDDVAREDVARVTRVAFDTLPPRRGIIVRKLVAQEPVLISNSTVHYDIENLIHLGLVTGEDVLHLSPHAQQLLGVSM